MSAPQETAGAAVGPERIRRPGISVKAENPGTLLTWLNHMRMSNNQGDVMPMGVVEPAKGAISIVTAMAVSSRHAGEYVLQTRFSYREPLSSGDQQLFSDRVEGDDSLAAAYTISRNPMDNRILLLTAKPEDGQDATTPANNFILGPHPDNPAEFGLMVVGNLNALTEASVGNDYSRLAALTEQVLEVAYDVRGDRPDPLQLVMAPPEGLFEEMAHDLDGTENVMYKETMMRKIKIEKPLITLSEVGGHGSAKDSLLEAAHPLFSSPSDMGGVDTVDTLLLHGSSGVGKTMLAEGIAGESDATILTVNTALLYDTALAQPERQIDFLFGLAREQHGAVVLVFDNADAFAGNGREMVALHNMLTQTLADRLAGLRPQERILPIFIAKDVDAVRGPMQRAGIAATEVALGMPDVQSRGEIFGTHLDDVRRRLPAESVLAFEPTSEVLGPLAEATEGFTGAEINQSIQAALRRRAARRPGEPLTQGDISDAIFARRVQRRTPPADPNQGYL